MCMVFWHGYRGLVHASILLFFQFVFGLAAPLAAQEAATQAPPAKVQQLIELLDDPDVRQWLAAKQTTATAAVMPPPGQASRLVAGIRRHLSGMRQAIPRVVPEWIAARARIAHELKSGVTRPIVWGLSLVLVVGYAAEFLTRYALRRTARRSAAEPGPGLAALIRIAPLVVFAIAAVATFAHTGWPSRLEAAVAPLVIAWIGARLLSAVASAAMESRYTSSGAAEGGRVHQRWK